MNKKATVITYGCQMNVNDSAKVKKILHDLGYTLTEDIYNSDLVMINTCTVREGAAKKVYGKLGELKNIKAARDGMIVGVIGCLAQEKKDEIYKKVRHVDFVMGNQNIHKLVEILNKIENQNITHIDYTDGESTLPPIVSAEFESNITAFISIMYGCNNFCTYCIVPHVRGRERSVPMQDVLKEVNEYLKKGYSEIYLLGQNVNSYGVGLSEGENFAKLLSEICKIEGKFRLRFTSPHPRDFTDDVIDRIAKEDKICKGIHLPLQAGATNVLRKMNRGYTKEDYLLLVNKIKNKIPEVSLTTDIIVGFPGETEKDFLDTLDVVEKVGYDNAYMFMYSKRSGTAAANMEDQIDDEVKNTRLQRLIELQRQKTKEESEKYQDKILEILVEGPTKKNDEMYTGRTDTNKVVIIDAKDGEVGKFTKVKIKEVRTWTLYGEVLN